MKVGKYLNLKDIVISENVTYKLISLGLMVLVIFLVFSITFKIENQKTIVMPPFLTLKEFWVAGDEVSDSYLEMAGDGITFNILNISPERKPNTEFLYSMTPSRYYNQVRSAIEEQIKFIQNNGISQVFYTTDYDYTKKGILKVKGILKQYVSDKRIESANYVLEIGYFIQGGRFWIKSLDLKREGEKSIRDEDKQ